MKATQPRDRHKQPRSHAMILPVWGRNALRGPFQQRFDTSIGKKFPLARVREGANLEFRTEFFKLFNNPIFSNPISNVSSGSFGRITSTTDTTGQIIQFALKLNY